MGLLDIIFGKKVKEGTELYVELNSTNSMNYAKGHYFKIQGYNGTFKSIGKEAHYGKKGVNDVYFVRENVPNSYNKKVKKLNVPKEMVKIVKKA